MRILFFTSTKAVHGRKWLESLASRFEVHVAVFSVEEKDRVTGVTYHEVKPRITSDVDTPAHAFVVRKGTAISDEARTTFMNGIKYMWAFARVIKTVQPHIVHAHQSVPFGWYAYCALQLVAKNIPFIVSVWGTDVETYPEQSRLFAFMNKRVLGAARAVTATSSALAMSARRWKDRNDWLRIPFGVNTKLFQKKATVSSAATVFGMAKRLRFVDDLDVYGFETAISAISLARKTNPQIRLEIAGDGPMRSHLEQYAHNAGVKEAVTFLGEIPQEQLGQVLSRWDALLLPSARESFGVAAVEALSVGIPVIAHRVGGVPEVIADSSLGELIHEISPDKLAYAMLHLSNANMSRAHKHGPQRVKKLFEWENNVTAMCDLYGVLS